MRLPRLYLQRPLAVGEHVSIEPAQVHYLRRVLRLGEGDHVRVFNGRGGEFLARIERLGKRDGCLRLEEHSAVEREPRVAIHLFQALVREEKLDQVIQKGTELGVASFVIFGSERSQVRLNGDRLASRMRRWRRIAQEAAEQSGRERVPSIQWRPDLDALDRPHQPAFALHPHAMRAWVDARVAIAGAAEVSYAVGPEGGWSARDLSRLEGRGFAPLRFVETVLRTETAGPAIAAATLAVHACRAAEKNR